MGIGGSKGHTRCAPFSFRHHKSSNKPKRRVQQITSNNHVDSADVQTSNAKEVQEPPNNDVTHQNNIEHVPQPPQDTHKLSTEHAISVQPTMKPPQMTLRKVSQHSIRPGQRFSLQISHTNLRISADISELFDLEDLISAHDMYNMLNDGAMKPFIHDPFNLLIIDSRDLDYYAPCHVITAKHHARIMSDDNFSLTLSNYSMIIIYGNEVRNDRDTKELANLQSEIREYVAGDILVLKDGFSCFQSLYPFLCTDREIQSIADRKLLTAYPSAVLENELYQGRGDQATNENIVNLLKITHIVNITMEHKNAFPGKVKYLKLVLEDVSDTNLFDHFYKTSDFIHAAISKGGRVLVHCNQGVSRSSTITLAYLMRFKKWNLEYAFNMLKARRSCTCPNPGFFRQLSDWEVKIFGKIETNIDLL